MPAELSLDDELSDDIAALRPLVARAATGDINPNEAAALLTRYDALRDKANENASAKRVGFALMHRGRTRHTKEIARSFLRLAN